MPNIQVTEAQARFAESFLKKYQPPFPFPEAVNKSELYLGDCLSILQRYVADESIHLIYIDPPFFTGDIQRDEEVTFDDSKRFWEEKGLPEQAPEWMKYITLKHPGFASYLYYMMVRLQACHKVMKGTGSIYLHCNWRASHYLKIVMDDIFGEENFRNDIAWCYSGPSQAKEYFPRKHDNILFYTRRDDHTFNVQRIPYAEGLSVGGEKSWAGEDRDIEEYTKRGKACEDWWTGIQALQRSEREKVGYPTQKPLELLKRIISASSYPGDTILDPFAGSGTTGIAACQLGRRCILIDDSEKAINIIIQRFQTLGQSITQIKKEELVDA